MGQNLQVFDFKVLNVKFATRANLEPLTMFHLYFYGIFLIVILVF